MVFALFYLIWCIDSWIMGYLCWIQSHSRCLADICGALHCDLVMDSVPRKTKCNPAAAAKNQHLCEVAMYEWCSPLLILAFFLYSYFNDLCRALLILVFQSMRVLQQAVFMVTFYFICHNCKFVTFYKFLSDNDIAFWCHRVVTEFFLRQFCDAHTCTGGRKPFSRGHRVKLTITLTSFLLCMLRYTLQARKQVTKTYSYTFLINLLKV